MNILFLTENFPPETNASATRVYERAVYWAKWGHQVTVITCAPNFPGGKLHEGWKNRWRQEQMMDGIRVVRVKTFIAKNEGFLLRTLDFVSFMITATIAALREPKPDVVAATSPQFFAAVAGWMIGAMRKTPFVFELGDLWPRSIVAVGAMKDSPLIRALERLELFLYRKAECVTALTRTFRQDLIGRGIPAEKIAVVINGVDLPRYAPRERDEEMALTYDLTDKFVIGYVGTHGMAHGLINVLDAAELLKDEDRLRFILVGAGAERKMLEKEAAVRGLPNVVFIPSQPKERMPLVWSLCDVALVHLKNDPVFAEVIPSKIFEAMGMGLPLLCVSPRGEASFIIETDQAGLWVPAGDPPAFAAAARRLLDDVNLRTYHRDKSLAAAPEHSREKQAALMLRVLDLAAQRRGSECKGVDG
ncbi:MAG: glycosyltransferase WbuB [Alphaproteobacteria bacterium RIFOXYD12_FULL_60_8]|nr:MAG: glycosyltransferase WbuB [Alphaproteobacteria bacterium RIFOXYD12_FULL_60_8]